MHTSHSMNIKVSNSNDMTSKSELCMLLGSFFREPLHMIFTVATGRFLFFCTIWSQIKVAMFQLIHFNEAVNKHLYCLLVTLTNFLQL